MLCVANGIAKHMSDACRATCIDRLDRARNEAVVLDRQYIILDEYQKNVNPNKQPPGPGDAFVKHLLQNMAVQSRVSLIDLNPCDGGKTEFEEFPDNEPLRHSFDPSDRKFVAASNAHPKKPPIVESADSKWLKWEKELAKHGIRLEILCRRELEAFLAKKTKRK